jgi:hypothetical protein
MGFYPVHDLRKVPPFAGYDEQVYVGRHNAKVGKPEPEPFPGIPQDQQHGFTSHIALEDPFFVIRP